MAETITLRSSIDYHPRFPPANAKKAYVARITGTVRGAAKYEREFLGEEVVLSDATEAGLYEQQNGQKKGGYIRYYYVVVDHPECGLIRSSDCEDILPQVAKGLQKGETIAELIEVADLDREASRFTAKLASNSKRSRKLSEKDSALTACRKAIENLTSDDRAAVLEALHNE